MLINFDVALTDISGHLVAENGKDVSIKTLVTTALINNYADETGLAGEEKFSRFNLALRLHNTSGAVEVSVEELVLIKKLVTKAYTTLAVGRIYALIEENPPIVRAF